MDDAAPEVDATIAGQHLKLSGANINTLFTILGFIVLCLVAWVLYAHADDAKQSNKSVATELKDANKEIANSLKEANKEMSEVLKEMARATREQNCLLSLPQDQRQKNADTCKRISQ